MSQAFVDNEEYPLKSSAGGRNAFYMGSCETIGYSPAYAICLNKINALARDGSLKDSPCEGAIRNRSCGALVLQAEEAKAGKAIYFINREKLMAFNAERDNRAKLDAKPAKKVVAAPVKPLPVAVAKHFLDVDTGSYADALNATLANGMVSEKLESPEVIVKPAAQLKQTPVAPVVAGMSLIEMARARLAEKSIV